MTTEEEHRIEEEMESYLLKKESSEIRDKINKLRELEYPYNYKEIEVFLNCGYALGDYNHWVFIDDDAIEENVSHMERKEKLRAVKENIKNINIDEIDLYSRCQTCPFNDECESEENIELCLVFSNKWYKENRRKK
ncbi:MAG: hypothetical protein B6I30_09510 [Desulfobacteraceae bacterium 4572_187]|nr:MAG: hypothetical protein B6I30_09510 [Desulfobacteraceae bacterium 4572_187]